MSLSVGHPPPLTCCLTTSPFSVFVSLFFARVRARSLSLSCIHARTHPPERSDSRTHIRTHEHTHTHTRTHTQTATYVHLLSHTPSHTHTHTRTHSRIYTLSLSHTHTHTHNCVCVVVHVDVCIHVYPCRSVRACVRACVHVCVRNMKETQILVFKIFGLYLHIYVSFGLYVYNRSPLLPLTLSQKSAI